MSALIFIVDDDADHLSSLADLVEASGYVAQQFPSAAEALNGMSAEPALLSAICVCPKWTASPL